VVNAAANGYVATALDCDGPAEQAGLKRGEVITAVDGLPADAANLSAVCERFRALPQATTIRLRVLRGANREVDNITLSA
jgi:S1-C subfamily serine protease